MRNSCGLIPLMIIKHPSDSFLNSCDITGLFSSLEFYRHQLTWHVISDTESVEASTLSMGLDAPMGQLRDQRCEPSLIGHAAQHYRTVWTGRHTRCRSHDTRTEGSSQSRHDSRSASSRVGPHGREIQVLMEASGLKKTGIKMGKQLTRLVLRQLYLRKERVLHGCDVGDPLVSPTAHPVPGSSGGISGRCMRGELPRATCACDSRLYLLLLPSSIAAARPRMSDVGQGLSQDALEFSEGTLEFASRTELSIQGGSAMIQDKAT